MRYLHTEEILKQVNTVGIILAGLVLAGPYVRFTAGTSPARQAFTSEPTHFILTSCSIKTRLRSAVIHVHLQQWMAQHKYPGTCSPTAMECTT